MGGDHQEVPVLGTHVFLPLAARKLQQRRAQLLEEGDKEDEEVEEEEEEEEQSKPPPNTSLLSSIFIEGVEYRVEKQNGGNPSTAAW